jgi:predicted transcriptional regulator
MAYSKKDQFPESDALLAEYHSALAHPARIAILRALAQRQSCVCGEIVSDLPLAQSTVSQHLKVLKEAGLIQGTVSGPSTCYCLDPDTVRRMCRMFDTQSRLILKEKKGPRNAKQSC